MRISTKPLTWRSWLVLAGKSACVAAAVTASTSAWSDGGAGSVTYRRALERLSSGKAPPAKIINGEPAMFQDNPWQVSLIVARARLPHEGHFCGGSIIHAEWVLTAAHCVDRSTSASEIQVVSGVDSLQQPGQRSRVREIVVHSGWDTQTMRNDIALLRIDGADLLLKGQAVLGPSAETAMLLRFLPVRVTGWGVSTNQEGTTPTLQGVELPYVPVETCNAPEAFRGDITQQMLCVGLDEENRGACYGDSGGPATVQVNGSPRQVGLVSFGKEGCRGRHAYSVFTRLSNYTQWVLQATGGAVDWR